MVAYSFQKRFVSHVVAGLEPGPWLPGMKRHTLRLPRQGRARHARPEQPLQLYTAMRTKHCRLIGRAVCRATIPVRLTALNGVLSLSRREGGAPRSYIMQLAPVVRRLLERPQLDPLIGDDMDEFARTDGFASAKEMAEHFEAPGDDGLVWHLDLVLIAWAPGDPL